MTRRFLIGGRVQGVGFRWYVAREARALGIAGYARNLADGRVEVLAEGDPSALARLERAVRAGPPSATVEAVECHDAESDHLPMRSFAIE